MLLASWLVVGCTETPAASAPPVPAASAAPSAASPAATRALLATADPKGDTVIDKELRARISAAQSNPQKLDLWILVGRSWVQKARNTGDPGFYLNADAAAETALAIDPKSTLAMGLRGMVMLNGHRFAEARTLAQGILALDPGDATGLGILSDAELELGNIPESIAAAEKMLEKKPDLPSYSRVSYLRWLRGDAAGAIEAMRLAFDAGRGQVDKEPAAWALSQSASYFWHLGDVEGASAGYELTLQYAPGYVPAMVGRARVAMARGKPELAVPLLERALSEQPLAETAWLLGDARAMAGDAAGAEKAYAELVRLGKQADPRTLALYYAAYAKETETAVKLAKAELDKRPGPHTRDAYAFALLRAGRAAEAKAELAPVAAMKIPEPAFQFHAALIAIANGDAAEGKKMLEVLMKKTPHFDRAGAEEARKVLGG